MAPLYKRYIPPNPSTESASVLSPAPSAKSIHTPQPVEPEKKRKRERTQEEVAERKAKKLKKKGIDPATVQSGSTPVEDVDTTIATEDGQEDGSFVPDAEAAQISEHAPGRGDGAAPKMSMKKRHKLEKEAREAEKARKRAAKQVGAEGDEGSNGTNIPISEKAREETSQSKSASTSRKDQKQAYSESPDRDSLPIGVTRANADRQVNIAEPEVEATTKESQLKKRRHKLEKVLEEPPNEDANDHLRKHTGILGKFEKSLKQPDRSEKREQEERSPTRLVQAVVKDLELPEPGEEPSPEFESEVAALPPWLAKPTILSANSQASFTELGLNPNITKRLSQLGFRHALPVQKALVPLLSKPGEPGSQFLPGTEDILPDVAVSAPTGSGKTIAYLLPIVEALRETRQAGKLSVLVVVPTRELVLQVAAVAESLAKGSEVKVGMATSTSRFKDEQERLIRRGRKYDPSGYRELMERAKRLQDPRDDDTEEFDGSLVVYEEQGPKWRRRIHDALNGLVQHVPTYDAAVDILVATPGRLLEHLSNTLGFSLVHLQWLVIDEADKLLDNQYEGFMELLNAEISRPRTEEEQDAREQYLREQGYWDERRERRLRKAVLSATMTRDISKLTSLQLRRPQMIVIRGERKSEEQATAGSTLDVDRVQESAGGFDLPPALVEFCVPVGDGSEKPLVMIELLASRILRETNVPGEPSRLQTENADAQSESSSASDDSSDISSDHSSSSSESDLDDVSDESDDPDSQEHETRTALDQAFSRRLAAISAQESGGSKKLAGPPTVLIFTASNESANRLSHLLKKLKPQWDRYITTLVKSAKPGKNSEIRIHSKKSQPVIVISTDRAARGLDNISGRPISHVIQYEVPRSVTSYVHRVGRTARAGREGDAWTLYTHPEARWFVNEITKASNVRRKGEVGRVKLFNSDEGLKAKYEEVLRSMREEVLVGADR
ncbi:DEAD box ATP-dependent RNA helicase like [Lecanosticta acicola]|uniref:ATP-dependent RNA helicase n=1 Tax=Lecanosticta acicola TaxID=111012 RepID=A0AAI8YRU6_9PEZI|nr:DEAD box ATP-dependent RNA helicase like [Lecanosticta acicola]